MNLAFPHTEYLLTSLAISKRPAAFPSRHHRRRSRSFTIYSHFNPSSFLAENLFHGLLSQFPSVNYQDFIAPTLGFASGLALYFSSKSRNLIPNHENGSDFDSHIGEWILFSSPTPFNRFVKLRCPSICFTGGELLENVNEKLVKEDRHYVNMNCGRIVQGKSEEDEVVGKLVYQRLCVGTEDGGVLSLDWPANLELEEERGLDTTVLIVPGTAEGSNEGKIKRFVSESLRRGVFPVVMNPRGCAGSPLTTPRLFTAADSDDIFTAVQFIHKKRPWTTFMGVGWGYGANMLTKYLAECGERTPLTAATCIDNPFDLEVATRSTLDDLELGQRLAGGLINVLQRNKELFQGRGKGFEVDKALTASSTRDFDRAISMVSYGFDNIEDFYEKSSTLDVVDKVKIPVLFIQNDDGTFPMFSIPRGLIAENPYTSLLLCSYSSSGRHSGSNFSWCLDLTIEWLNAVELGLLKGRHPLLMDVDATVNPLKGLALLGSKASSKSNSEDKILNLPNGYAAENSTPTMLDAYDMTAKFQSRSSRDIGRMLPQTEGLQDEDSDVERQPNANDSKVEEEASNSFENERGQVLQTAQVVMNMLDVTMPATLSEEQKKKVLDAVGRGEMLMKAMKDAVPEDVREKLTSSVSEILQSQRSNIKFDELLRLGHIPNVASGLNSKLLQKIGLSRARGDEEIRSSDQNIMSNEPGNGIGHSSGKLHMDMESENQQSEKLERINDSGLNQSTGSQSNDNLTPEKDDQKGMENNSENKQFSGHNLTKNSYDNENVSERSAHQEFSDQNEGPGETHDVSNVTKKMEKEKVEGKSNLRENNNEDTSDVSNDQSNVKEADQMEGNTAAPSSFPLTQPAENEAENNQQKNEKAPQPVSSQISAAPPIFDMLQALDALTGFDDSTQVAVNSVFQVVEGMLNQLEVKKQDQNQVRDENNKLDVNRGDMVKNLREDTLDLTDHDQESKRVNNLWRNPGIPGYWLTFPYKDPIYKEYLKAYLLAEMRKAKPAVLDTKSALYLNYFPEDDQWKLLEQMEDGVTSGVEFTTCDQMNADSRSKYTCQVENSGASSVGTKVINERLPEEVEDESSVCLAVSKDEDKNALQGSSNNKGMLGAVTAALGASAVLIRQQNSETGGTLMEPLKEKEDSEDPSKLEEIPEKTQNNIVTSLAEKAMSVASPVVPTTEDGEVDHARLVTMLAELGQKGGILKLVGKVALLWGGIRGAMSLTDKLISFLHIAERPLFQRILGFIFMVLLLWSPVILPLFPLLMRSWTTHNPFKIVELTCITGLYISVIIMVMLWGKRIRKYDDPLVQYGLDFTSIPKFKNFLMSLTGGAMLVLLIQSVNSSLGCVQFCWPTTLSSSYSEPIIMMKSYAKMLLLIVQGIATATGVAAVEELLFRSWLPEEISADLGYHRGLIISGLVFALSQRSIWEIPGLWLLSLSLSGARQRREGSLSIPVGLRTGILSCSFILQMGGFLTYRPNLPLWFSGGHPSQPFSGVFGLAFSLVLAIIMYPHQSPLHKTKTSRAIKD